jgi:hypothetical protein
VWGGRPATRCVTRQDPLWSMVGADGDGEPASVDDIVYPR